jgi:hypothetical protein
MPESCQWCPNILGLFTAFYSAVSAWFAEKKMKSFGFSHNLLLIPTALLWISALVEQAEEMKKAYVCFD